MFGTCARVHACVCTYAGDATCERGIPPHLTPPLPAAPHPPCYVSTQSDIIHAATGNRLNFDALCWHVDPADANPSAFSPHRDRQPDDAPATFRADGTAMYATAWVPFTDAKPENSCLYVIPRPHDPGYFQGDDDDPTVDKDPLQLCLPRKEAYQHITAIPAEAGSAVVFTHRIIHWGSRGRGRPASYEAENANSQTPLPPLEPRVCISFGFADDAYEPAYVSRAANLPFPPMAHRAALVSAQSIAYHERFHPGVRMLRLMHDAVTNPAVDGVFEAKYRKKVMFEYVQAAAAAAGGAGGKGMNKNASKAKAAAGASGASGASGDNSLAGRGRKMHPTPSRGTGVGADDDDDDGEDDSDGDKLEGEEEDDDDEGADDAMERALEAMIDAKMDGAGDNFVDDFDNFEDGVLEDEDGVSLVEPAALSSGKKRKKNGGGGVGMSSGGGKKRR
jgi:hypothetical protein